METDTINYGNRYDKYFVKHFVNRYDKLWKSIINIMQLDMINIM